MPTIVRALTTAQYQALLVGLPKYCANTVFTIGEQSFTTPQVVALITAILNAALAVPPAKATWMASIAATRQAEAQDGQTVKKVRDVVALMFESSPTTLANLAIPPKKSPKPLSGEARAAATVKAKATRLARGTASKKQKALVTGNVTGVTITPVTDPSPAPAAAPATAVVSGSGVAGTVASVVGSTPHT